MGFIKVNNLEILENGDVCFYINNRLFYKVLPGGTEIWYSNGYVHREGEPAIVHENGTEYWYQAGEYHREDGPAILYADGYGIYYMNGIQKRSSTC